MGAIGAQTIINDLIDEKLLALNTAFLAKVISVSGNSAKIQPLNRVKQYGGAAKTQAVLTDVPILHNAKYKLKPVDVEYVESISTTHSAGYVSSVTAHKKTLKTYEREGISKGDIVFCVCSDRDSTEAKRGNISTPPVGHHNQSDAFIVGIYTRG